MITEHVVRTGILRDDGFGTLRQTLDLQAEQVEREEVRSAVNFGVRLTLYSRQGQQADAATAPTTVLYRYGERISAMAKLRPPRNFRNPGAFDYQRYLEEKGIAALGTGKATEVHLLQGSWVAGSNYGDRPLMRQSSKRFMRSGHRRMLRCSTPWSLAMTRSSIATRGSIFSGRERITYW